MIIGRCPELAVIGKLLDRARKDVCGLVVLEGSMGIGKTELLREAEARAARLGFHVMSAAADIEEQRLQLGVVQQLFDKHGDQPGVLGDDGGFTTLQSLYRRLADLSGRSPVLVTVDNLEFADLRSLHWLNYAVRRLRQLPVAVLATVNPGERFEEPCAVSELMLSPVCVERRRMSDLPPDEAAALLRVFAGGSADPRIVAQACQVAGGNPLLLREYARAASAAAGMADGAAPPAGGFRQAELLSGLVPLRERLLAQLRRADPRSVRVLCLAALLGEQAAADLVEGLCGLPAPDFAQVRGRLEELGVMRAADSAVRYPLIGDLLVSRIPVAEKARLHADIARALHRRGAASERIAMHLVEADSSSEPWAQRILLQAGRSLVDSFPHQAVRVYKRVLEEPIGAGRQAEVLTRLGIAQLDTDVRAAVHRLDVALELAQEPGERARIAIGLARALVETGRGQEAVALLECEKALAVEVLDGAREAGRLAEQLVVLGAQCRETLDKAFALLDSGESGAACRGSRVTAVLRRAWLGVSAASVRHQAHRVLAQERAPRGTSAWFAVASSLLWSEEYDAALQLAGEELRTAGPGASLRRAHALLLAAEALRGLDRLVAARQHAAEALALLDRMGIGEGPLATAVLAVQVELLADLGEQDNAAAMVANRGWREIPVDHWGHVRLLHSRSVLRLWTDDHGDGLADATAVRTACQTWRMRNPAIAPWQSVSVEHHLALRSPWDGRPVAEQGLTAARRWGSPRSLGRALRAAGLTQTGTRRLALLEESAQVLAGCGAKLELARTLAARGALLAKVHPANARRTLRQAYELAVLAEAKGLARRVQDDLANAGGRRTRPAERGIDLLTASELRVARMAATGLTNQAIALRLKVSLRNIEAHLTHSYRKLGVAGRRELAELLRRCPADGRSGPARIAATPETSRIS